MLKKKVCGELITMVVTLWAIWHARRKSIHEDIHQTPMSTRMLVMRFIAELEGLPLAHQNVRQVLVSSRSHAISNSTGCLVPTIQTAGGTDRNDNVGAAAALA